ncbi:MAG: hypothetical protein ACOCYN_02050 [Planctomycetota bacterium]
MRPLAVSILVLLVLSGSVGIAAWWPAGHRRSTVAVGGLLGEDLPAFFRSGIDQAAHCAMDPDIWRREQCPQLRASERAEHFCDLELLEGAELPDTRPAFHALCRRRGHLPHDVGQVPYAVMEWTQRLAVAFAEHRRWPRDRHIRHKALVYAGLLAHYAQDLCQPLHTTIHYDGRRAADGSSPRSGIHAQVDALLVRVALPHAAELADAHEPFPDLAAGVRCTLMASHALVDRVYALADRLPPAEPGHRIEDPAVRAFASERAAAALIFTARLYATAWALSERIALPDWLERG